MYTPDYAVNSKISLCEVDITNLNTDCIFNAATETLEGGGGIDGVIHRAAGPDILKACNKCNKRCESGGCKFGFNLRANLRANYILHTVGPRDPDAKDASHKLKSCYENCLRQVLQNNIKSIVFCCITIGIFNFD